MKLFNHPENALREAAEGMLFSRSGDCRLLETNFGCGIVRRELREGCVRILVNGGGGYGPMWMQFASNGLADAIVCGEFNSAPNAYTLYETGKKIDCGQGVLLLANHFMGDYLNNDMAVDLLRQDGVAADACYVSDNLFSCAGEPKEARNGLCGIGLICKVLSDAAGKRQTLQQLGALADKCNDRLRSVSICVRETGELCFGCGFSGEPAAEVFPYRSCDDLAERAVGYLLRELPDDPDDQIFFMVDRSKGTGSTEGFVILNSVRRCLERAGRKICGAVQGDYFDVFSGSGCMISFLSADAEIRRHLGLVNGYEFTI